MNKKVITRVAPAPSGLFHIGTLRTALLNYLYARANNGEFILRIDDTDQDRGNESYIDYIYDQMSTFKLDHDSTFRQSERLERYQEVAYMIGQEDALDGSVSIDMKEYQMNILRADNGYPLYNFASTLDDYDYNITHIIRGTDHISNEPKQRKVWELLNEAFGEDKPFPELIHAGLLLDGKTGRKISKRDGSGLVSDYSDYSNEAILNWILKLGWSSKDSKFDKMYPTLNIEQMISVFNSGNINQSNTKVFVDKLKWLHKKFQNEKRKTLLCNS